MSELYWIHVLGGIHDTFSMFTCISGITGIISFLIYAVCGR